MKAALTTGRNGAMKSSFAIEYNGVEATGIIANDSDSFTWKDNATGEADTLTISLSNIGRKWMDGFYPSENDVLKAWIQVEEWAADYGNGRIYCGQFQVDSLKYTGWPEKLQLSAISVPVNSDFNVKQKSRTWEATTVKTVLGDIAGNAGIELVYDADDCNIDSISQSGKTDLSFAYSLCSEYGLSLKLYNNKMVAYNQTDYEKKGPSYSISHSSLGGSGAYAITSNITSVYDSAKIQYTDGNGDTLSYEYTIPGKAGNRQMFISAKAESYGDAEIKAKAALRDNLRKSKSITLKVMGSAKYIATQCFDLIDFGKLSGKYFIDSVTHAKSAGNYTCTIVAHPTVTDF